MDHTHEMYKISRPLLTCDQQCAEDSPEENIRQNMDRRTILELIMNK
jgi:hypothetical protein